MTAMVSVIISNLFERRLPETVESLTATADGPIEIIVKDDEDCKGMRHHLNQAAREAKGEFLFKVDGHCILTPHWDTILKTVGENSYDMAICRIRAINDRTWTLTERSTDFVDLNSDLTLTGGGGFVMDDPDTAETMASIGCGWLIHKQRYFDLEGCWEQLGRYGNLGAEWALKIWLSGGRLLINRYVTCGHVFRKQGVAGCRAPEQLEFRKLLGWRFASRQGPQQIRPLQWLAEHFGKIRDEVKSDLVQEQKT